MTKKQELNFFFSFNIKINKRTDKATYIINIALWDEQTDIEIRDTCTETWSKAFS